MRKRSFKVMKRGMAVLLAGVMLAGMAGCAKNNDEAQVRKEFYYVPEYKSLDINVDYVSNVFSYEDELILIGSNWSEEGESESKLYRYHLLTDECDEIILPFSDNTSIQRAVVDSEGELLAVTSRYEEAGKTSETQSGTENELQDTAEEAEETSKQDTDTEETEAADALSAEAGAVSEAAGESDVIIEENYEEVEYESYIELCKISLADGSMISQKDMKPVFDDPNASYVQNMIIDSKDNIYISDSNSTIYILDTDGNKLGSIATDSDWIDSLFKTKEDQIYLKTWGNEGEEIRPVDAANKTVGEAVKSENLSGTGYNQSYYEGSEKGVLISDSNGVFIYDFENDTKEELFDWIDADILSENVDAMGVMPDGRYFVFLREYTNEKTEYSLAYLTKTPASEMPEKEELIFGAMWLNQSMRKNIIDFNKSSDKYHITVKEYASDDDYDTGLTQFNNDITSGSGPDIIDISNMDLEQYASKGVLEDLYSYMEKDGINKADYLENVFKAYEVDGKLYALVPQFYVSTTIAKTAKVGETTGWTLSEMLDFAENSNAENIFQYGSRSSIFYYCIYNNIDEFINWETGECFFNGEDFIRVLEFANKFPEEPDYNNSEGTSARLRADKILLMQSSLSSVQEYQMYNGLFGEEVTFIGYPNSERKGNLIQPANGSVALSAGSKHKAGAWEFIKTLISDEYQDSLVNSFGSGWGFPIKKSALEKQFEQDMTPDYYEDENGNKVEQVKTGWGYDDFSIDIYAATQEEVDAVREIISSAEKSAGSVNTELTNIMEEETAAFFKGQKSAKDTAEIIQNRIQIYVKENS